MKLKKNHNNHFDIHRAWCRYIRFHSLFRYLSLYSSLLFHFTYSTLLFVFSCFYMHTHLDSWCACWYVLFLTTFISNLKNWNRIMNDRACKVGIVVECNAKHSFQFILTYECEYVFSSEIKNELKAPTAFFLFFFYSFAIDSIFLHFSSTLTQYTQH